MNNWIIKWYIKDYIYYNSYDKHKEYSLHGFIKRYKKGSLLTHDKFLFYNGAIPTKIFV